MIPTGPVRELAQVLLAGVPIPPGPRTSFSYEQIYDWRDVFVVHPDWQQILAQLRDDTLMSEDRYAEIRAEVHARTQAKKRRIGSWAWYHLQKMPLVSADSVHYERFFKLK